MFSSILYCLDFIFLVYLTLYNGNQVADCWFHPPGQNCAHCGWLEAELSLQAGRAGAVELPGGCGSPGCVTQPGSSGFCSSRMHIFHWSVKTAAICPKCVCVVYWKVLPVPTGVWWGFAATEVWNAHFGVALPGCQTLQRPIPSSGQVSHPCLLKTGVSSLENDTSRGKSCTV